MTNRTNGVFSLLVACAMTAAVLGSAPAQARDGISIPLPPLPPIPQIRLKASPLMVWLPTPGVHVALDSPYPIFAHEDRYYLHSNNVWYVGPGYAGPWTSVHIHLLPPGLRHYRGHEWQHYQHEARYRHDHNHHTRPHFYGHHARGHHNTGAPQYWHGPVRPHPEHRPHSDRRGHSEKRAPVRDHGDSRTHGTRHERARFNSHTRKQNFARAQHRGDDRGHGNQHWRMGY